MFRIAATLMLGTCSVAVSAQSKEDSLREGISEELVRKFSSSIKNEEVQIGVFKVPELRQMPVAMKSGVFAEMQSNYSEIMNRYSLTKLNLIHSIRGGFDQTIFVEAEVMSLGKPLRYTPKQFYAYPGSKWIILLLKSVTPTSRLKLNGRTDLTIDSTGVFLNETTLYHFTENGYGAICVYWPPEFPKPPQLIISSPELVDDLQTLVDFVDTVPMNNKQAPLHIRSEYGIGIYKNMISN